MTEREKANKILLNNIPHNFKNYLQQNDFIKYFIINAMIEYSESKTIDIHMSDVKKIVEDSTGIQDISCLSRRRHKYNGRVIFSYICYKIGYRSTDISKMINRTHSTVLNHFKRHEEFYKYDAEYRDIYKKCLSACEMFNKKQTL